MIRLTPLLLALLLGLSSQSFAQYPHVAYRLPEVHIEPHLRQANWMGSQWEGSCVHATVITLLNNLDKSEAAVRWRRTYENGSYYSELASFLNAEGLVWTGTDRRNDIAFLEWACDSGRGCGVAVHGRRHMVTLVHLDARYAAVIDPNTPSKVIWYKRDDFLRDWLASGSWAFTLVYTPPAPHPYSE